MLFKIILSSSTSYLENARDVLPEINRIFRNLEPLIIKNIGESNKEIEAQLKRFSDASGDTVPICVLGTYSAGKSTFINALIGQELLPSAETPVTAKSIKSQLVLMRIVLKSLLYIKTRELFSVSMMIKCCMMD